MSANHLYLVAVAATICCAPAGAPDTSGATVPRRANLLTAQEIADAHADTRTAYDAVARLRPNWLAPRGATSFATAGTDYAFIFVEGQEYGSLPTLKNIPAYEVGEMQYYDVSQAGGRFGLRAGSGGAIEVRLKKPR